MKQGASAGYVIYKKSFRENSYIIDFFTQHYGRVSVLGRAKKKRGVHDLSPFEMFVKSSLAWRGRGDLASLSQIEPMARVAIARENLLFGMYANELLLRLLEPGEDATELFARYEYFLRTLAAGTDPWGTLIFFELDILCALGHDLLACDGLGDDTQGSSRRYYYDVDAGYRTLEPSRADSGVSLKTINTWRLGEPLSGAVKHKMQILIDSVLAQVLTGVGVKSRCMLPRISG